MKDNFSHPHLNPNGQQKKLNAILTLQRQNDIIAMLLEGKDVKTEITPYIKNKYRLKAGTVHGYISEARQIIKKRLQNETNALVSLHMERYEKIYKGLYEVGAFGIAMNALKSKEKLLQFHKEGFHMKITQGEVSAFMIENIESEYDPSKLEPQKRDRLSFLISKSKKDGLGKDRKAIQ